MQRFILVLVSVMEWISVFAVAKWSSLMGTRIPSLLAACWKHSDLHTIDVAALHMGHGD
jgi:hypothetical protein